jgi:outer membrane biosynthesis protein TonB
LYLDVDELPKFQDNDEPMMQFIYRNFEWPDGLDVSGKVIVSFVVTKNGDVCDVKIQKGLCESCDNEVKRVISLMSKWKPGTYKNRPVNVILYIPIVFQLKE